MKVLLKNAGYTAGESANPMEDIRSQLAQAKLTDRQLACLALYYFDGMNQREIAERLGIGQRAVAYHINAGLAKLAQCGMTPKRMELEFTPLLQTNINMDALGPDDIKAVF